MGGFDVLFIPVGISNFHLPSAKDQFVRSCAQVRALCPGAQCPPEPLLDMESLEGWLEGKQPDLVIFLNLTFANGAYAAQAARRFACPLVVFAGACAGRGTAANIFSWAGNRGRKRCRKKR